MTRMELKEKAKASLKGKWGQAIALFVIYFAIIVGANLLSDFIMSILHLSKDVSNLIKTVMELIVQSLFIFGVTSFYLKLARGEEVKYDELFSKTTMFGVAITAVLLTGIFTFLWTLLLIIPGIIAAISYSQVYFIMLDNPEMSAMDAIKKSKEIMKGHKVDYVILCLSFLGWAILATLTFGIGYLWLISYIQVTMSNFYDSIKEQ